MSANFKPNLGSFIDIRPFKFWCSKVLPLVYDDSLSYYELLCKVVDYLNETMKNVSELNEGVQNIGKAYDLLEQYVNNYFSELNVQEQINNKLDAMAKDGTLDEIINVHIFGELNDKITGNTNDIKTISERLEANIKELTDLLANVNTKVDNNQTAINDKVTEIEEKLFVNIVTPDKYGFEKGEVTITEDNVEQFKALFTNKEIDVTGYKWNISEHIETTSTDSLRIHGALEVTLTGEGKLSIGGGGERIEANILQGVAYQNTITMSTINPNIKVGDYIQINSDDSYNAERVGYVKGQFDRVIGINGSVITLEAPLRFDYNTNPKIAVLPLITLIADKFIVHHQGTIESPFNLRHLVNSVVDSIVVTDETNADGIKSACNIYKCYNSTFNNIESSQLSTVSHGLDYGVFLGCVENVVINNVVARGYRHALTTGASGISPVPEYIVNNNVTIINGTFYSDGDQPALSLHGNIEHFKVLNGMTFGGVGYGGNYNSYHGMVVCDTYTSPVLIISNTGYDFDFSNTLIRSISTTKNPVMVKQCINGNASYIGTLDFSNCKILAGTSGECIFNIACAGGGVILNMSNTFYTTSVPYTIRLSGTLQTVNALGCNSNAPNYNGGTVIKYLKNN